MPEATVKKPEAKATQGREGSDTLLPFSPSASANWVTGIRQRQWGFGAIPRHIAFVRSRTLFTGKGFIGSPVLLDFWGSGKPHVIDWRMRPEGSSRITIPGQPGTVSSPELSGSGTVASNRVAISADGFLAW